jgi:acyl carrier protein
VALRLSQAAAKNVNPGIQKLCWTKVYPFSQDDLMTANNSSGDIKEKVRAFVLEYAADRGVTSVADDEPILTNNIIDSLGSLRMIDFLETAFPLTIEDTDMLPENFQTLNACEIFIQGKLGITVNGSKNGAEEPMATPTPAPELVGS